MTRQGKAVAAVEVQGLPPAVVVADAMVKAALVRLVALEANTLGAVTVKVEGDTGAARASQEAGKRLAEQLDAFRGATFAPSYSESAFPLMIDCQPSVSRLLNSRNHLIPSELSAEVNGVAFGLIETIGYVGALAALDAMLKAAAVEVVAKEKIGQTRVAMLIRGEVAAVRAAVAAGAAEATRIGTLASSHTIPQPDPVIQRMFPK